jgi:hypothetical protein
MNDTHFLIEHWLLQILHAIIPDQQVRILYETLVDKAKKGMHYL